MYVVSWTTATQNTRWPWKSKWGGNEERGGGKPQLLSSSRAGLMQRLHHTGSIALLLPAASQPQGKADHRVSEAEIPLPLGLQQSPQPDLSSVSLGLFHQSLLVCDKDQQLGESKADPHICLCTSQEKKKQTKKRANGFPWLLWWISLLKGALVVHGVRVWCLPWNKIQLHGSATWKTTDELLTLPLKKSEWLQSTWRLGQVLVMRMFVIGTPCRKQEVKTGKPCC